MPLIDLNKHFNSQTIKSSDFYSPAPPASVQVHPTPINLSGGRPNTGFYPIKSIDLNLKHNPFDPDDAETFKFSINEKDSETLDIANGLQYAPARGHVQLLEFFENLVEELNPPKHSEELSYIATSGSGDSLYKLLAVLLNPGETVLVEAFTYTPIFAPISALGGIKIPYKVKFKTGGDVIDIAYLKDLLENWESHHKELPKPKLIYTVPTQNPSGITQPLKIREELYKLAQEHDLIILEDDPDGYIRLNEITNDTYFKAVEKASYLNLDTDGRVIRFETFSKLYAPGIRLGFIVALKGIIDRVLEYAKIATKAPSGFSQLILYNTLKSWSETFVNSEYRDGDRLVRGYLEWNLKVSKEFSKRRDLVIGYLKSSKSAQNGYIEVVEPDGGMFFVLKINFKGNDDGYIEDLKNLRYKLLKTGVLTILGNLMSFDQDVSSKAKFIRLTLANVDGLQDLQDGVERLDQGIVDYFEDHQSA